MMEIPVLYEDEDLIVIDKPSGIVVNRADTVREETIQDWWDEVILPKVKKSELTRDDEAGIYFRERSGLVHRLDRETSGVMVMAKSVAAFTELLRQFKEREIQKEYLALTHGVWQVPKGEIAASVGRMRHNRQMMGVREDGRESVTEYEVIQEYESWSFPKELKVDPRGYVGFTLVRFWPKSGRTHQIRVHARHLNHPLVGDMLYAGRKRSREDRKWAGRVLLQADKIRLYHPLKKTLMEFASKGDEISKLLTYFEPKS